VKNRSMVDDLKQLARRMLADYDARTPGQIFAQPLDLTIFEAYALQAEIVRLREQRGEKVIGYKVGCTSAAMQQQLGLGEPIFAAIFDTGCFPDGAELSYRCFANLAVEGELAVRMGRDLPAPPVGVHDCRAAIASVFPVIELHHYVLHSLQPSLAELVASGGMHAGFVSAEVERDAGLGELESLSLWLDDQRMGTVAAGDLTGMVLQSLSWLVSKLADAGLALARGQIVLTGSLLNLYPVGPGRKVIADVPPIGRSSAVIVP
jgi:2-keto-4-pentenoate hydratase